MMGNLRITLTITNLRVFFKSSLIAKIMRSFKLIIAQLLKPEVLQYGTSGLFFQKVSSSLIIQALDQDVFPLLLNHSCPVFFWSIKFSGQQ